MSMNLSGHLCVLWLTVQVIIFTCDLHTATFVCLLINKYLLYFSISDVGNINTIYTTITPETNSSGNVMCCSESAMSYSLDRKYCCNLKYFIRYINEKFFKEKKFVYLMTLILEEVQTRLTLKA